MKAHVFTCTAVRAGLPDLLRGLAGNCAAVSGLSSHGAPAHGCPPPARLVRDIRTSSRWFLCSVLSTMDLYPPFCYSFFFFLRIQRYVCHGAIVVLLTPVPLSHLHLCYSNSCVYVSKHPYAFPSSCIFIHLLPYWYVCFVSCSVFVTIFLFFSGFSEN